MSGKPVTYFQWYPLSSSSTTVGSPHASNTACVQELVLALRASCLATVIITNGHPEIQVPSCPTNAHVPWPCSALGIFPSLSMNPLECRSSRSCVLDWNMLTDKTANMCNVVWQPSDEALTHSSASSYMNKCKEKEGVRTARRAGAPPRRPR